MARARSWYGSVLGQPVKPETHPGRHGVPRGQDLVIDALTAPQGRNLVLVHVEIGAVAGSKNFSSMRAIRRRASLTQKGSKSVS